MTLLCLSLAEAFAAGPPTVTYFSPTGGPPGTQVIVVGDNFDNDGANDMQVSINGVPADVLLANGNEMLLAVTGDLSTSGPLVLKTAAGETSTTQPFLFSPLSLRLDPERFQIFTGQQRAVNAIPIGTAQGVSWKINGVVGGNATFGTITQALAASYTAPAASPGSAPVLITATSLANPAVQATARAIVTDAAAGVPSIGLLPSDPADFMIDPDTSLNISRTRLLMLMEDGASLAPLVPIFNQLHAEIIGGVPEFSTMEIAIPDSADLTAVNAAIDTLTSAPQVLVVEHDNEMGSASLPKRPPDDESDEVIEGNVIHSGDKIDDLWKWDLNPAGDNWGMEFANFPQAWNLFHYVENFNLNLPAGQSKRIVNVGVADEPVLTSQQDLAGLVTRFTKGFQRPEGDTHGTHVTGIIAADWRNGKGIVGASPFVHIFNQPWGNFVSGPSGYVSPGSFQGSNGEKMLIEVAELIHKTDGQHLRAINYSQVYNWYIWEIKFGLPPFKWRTHFEAPTGKTIVDALTDLTGTPEFHDRQRKLVEHQGRIALKIADYIAKGPDGKNTLFMACAGNDREDIRLWLSSHNVLDETSNSPGAQSRMDEWNAFNSEFASPFTWAAYHGATNVLVIEALEKHSDRNAIERTDFSNIALPNANHPDFHQAFSAPGRDIMSTSAPNSPGDIPHDTVYQRESGTSQATPHVTGLVAYLCAIDPDLSGQDILDILNATSRPYLDNNGHVAGPPVIDAFKAVMQIDEINKNGSKRKWVKKALLNVDDGTPDGNDRNVADDAHGSGITPPDMRINMADFRRARDAYLLATNNAAYLNGPATSLKRDINEDGRIEGPDAENIYPREDFDGDGVMTTADLDQFADVDLWNDDEIPVAGLDNAALKKKLSDLLFSGDFKINADAIFADPAIDSVHVTAYVKMGDGSTQQYSIVCKPTDVLTTGPAGKDLRKILTVPANLDMRLVANAYEGNAVKYYLLDGNLSAATSLHSGQDKDLNLQKTQVSITPATFTVAYNDRALIDIQLKLDDGTTVKADPEYYKAAFNVPTALGSVQPSTSGGYVVNSGATPGTYTIGATVTTTDGDKVNPADDPVAHAVATVRTAVVKNPGGLALDGLKNLYVTDTLEGNVLFIPPGDAGLKLLTGLDHPGPIDVDPKGRSLIVGEAGGKVTRYFFGLSGKVVDQSGALVVGANVFVDTPAGTIPGTGAVPNRIKTSTDGRFTVLGLLAPEMGKDPVKVAVTIEYNGKTQAFPVTLKTTGQTIMEFKLAD